MNCPLNQCFGLAPYERCEHWRWSAERRRAWLAEMERLSVGGASGAGHRVGSIERYSVDSGAVAEAVHSVLGAHVRAEVGRQVRRAGLMGLDDEAVCILLDDDDPREMYFAVEPAEVGRALGDAVGQTIRPEVHGAMNALRGRVDSTSQPRRRKETAVTDEPIIPSFEQAPNVVEARRKLTEADAALQTAREARAALPPVPAGAAVTQDLDILMTEAAIRKAETARDQARHILAVAVSMAKRRVAAAWRPRLEAALREKKAALATAASTTATVEEAGARAVRRAGSGRVTVAGPDEWRTRGRRRGD